MALVNDGPNFLFSLLLLLALIDQHVREPGEHDGVAGDRVQHHHHHRRADPRDHAHRQHQGSSRGLRSHRDVLILDEVLADDPSTPANVRLALWLAAGVPERDDVQEAGDAHAAAGRGAVDEAQEPAQELPAAGAAVRAAAVGGHARRRRVPHRPRPPRGAPQGHQVPPLPRPRAPGTRSQTPSCRPGHPVR